MVFELAREDNPRLFDELSKFPQGPRRVNRLRVLAYDGLLVQSGVLALAQPDGANAQRQGRLTDSTNAVFGPAIDE
jgi:hypothetical protein